MTFSVTTVLLPLFTVAAMKLASYDTLERKEHEATAPASEPEGLHLDTAKNRHLP